MSYPDDPALAFRNILIESSAAMAGAILAALGVISLRLDGPLAWLAAGAVGICCMDAVHDRLRGNRPRGKAGPR